MDWPLSSALPQLAALGKRLVPQTVGDRRTGWAYGIGYIRALYDMARAAVADPLVRSARGIRPAPFRRRANGPL